MATSKDGTTIDFGFIELTGTLHHDDDHRALWLETDEGPERLSVDLKAYDLVPEPGCVFVKDWSEHEGLTRRLTEAGLVEPVHDVSVGPFNSTAYEVRVLI